jgi:hypothetical protein
MSVRMIYVVSILLSLMFLQADEPQKDLEQLRREAREAAERHREEAIRLNDLAGHLKTESDAENLVDSIAKMFADELPPPWATRGVRHRMARAEFCSGNGLRKANSGRAGSKHLEPICARDRRE